jgi:tetratricopeptide (TPR) repeat protein
MGERYEECVPILTEVHTKRMRVLGADHPSTLLSALNLGSVLREVGRFDEAGVHLRDAYDGLRLIFGAEHPDALVAANRIGGLRVAQGRVEEGVELLKVSIEASRRVFGDGATETTSTLNQLGYALWMLERPAEAVPYLELSHAGTQRVFGDAHPNTALVAANLGVNLCECGRAAEGVVYLQAAWNVFEADPSMLWIANTLMKNLIALERRDDALSVAHSALEKVRTLIADDELQLSNALENFGNDFLGLDDVAGAEEVLRECVELRERLQPDAWRTFMARSMLGEALLRQGRFADAEPHLLAGQAGLATLAERAATLPPEAAVQLSASGARVVALYERWHAAEPDAGHDVSAEEWRAKLGP